MKTIIKDMKIYLEGMKALLGDHTDKVVIALIFFFVKKNDFK